MKTPTYARANPICEGFVIELAKPDVKKARAAVRAALGAG